MAPDPFAGILAAVPFVDSDDDLDPSLPLTVTEGTSGETLRARMSTTTKSYCRTRTSRKELSCDPGNDVVERHQGALRRTRQAGGARHTKTDDHPVLLKTEMNAGHGGISGRYERWKKPRSSTPGYWMLPTPTTTAAAR
jgi:oligopeptidase B